MGMVKGQRLLLAGDPGRCSRLQALEVPGSAATARCLPLFHPLTTRRHPTQDEEGGGISDRPEDQADVYHTFFGIAGLSLMGRSGLAAIDPTFALPEAVVARLRARRQQPGGEQQQAEREGEEVRQPAAQPAAS